MARRADRLEALAREIGTETGRKATAIAADLAEGVARAALAIDEAPLMLKHLFGHKDIEMTLHYILADKALAAEMYWMVSRNCLGLLQELQ